MVGKRYKWHEGVDIEPHTQKKHHILREYFTSYLLTRCQYPTRRFKLMIVDGFAGSGQYNGDHSGSPLIFLEVLQEVVVSQNIKRERENLPPLVIECMFCMNDIEREALSLLKDRIAPLLRQISDLEHLAVSASYFALPFNEFYWRNRAELRDTKCSNVFFNLDQCGYVHVESAILRDIMSSWKSAEIMLTFVIESLLAFLSHKQKGNGVLEPALQTRINRLSAEFEQALYNKASWLGKAERVVFDYLSQTADFVSPFSINNPDGWRYWLMHFASSYRARQVFNNVLHQDISTQAHFGRAGLRMLSYDPKEEGQLYLFNDSSREAARQELYEDIPNVISKSGDVLLMDDFYRLAYNETAAHSDDIHDMMIENPDIDVLTDTQKGSRRKGNAIKSTDILQLKKQRSLFFLGPIKKKE